MKLSNVSTNARILLTAVLCASVSPCWGQNQDVTPPTLTGLSFSPATINTAAGPATVSVTISATDDLSGAAGVQVRFVSPSGLQSWGASPNFSPPGTSVHTTVNVTFPQFSETGTWKLSQVLLFDSAGNVGSSDPARLGVPTELIMIGQQDVTPPIATGLSFAPATINTATGPATVTVSLSATDDLSGVSAVQMRFVSPSGTQSVGASPNFSPPPTSVHTTVNVTFPQFGETGIWKVSGITVFDALGNNRTFDPAQMGFPTDLIVIGQQDVTPPNLTGFSFSPTSINTASGPATVTVSFSATDDLSGVAGVQVRFVSPSGGQSWGASPSISPPSSSGHTTATVTFPQFGEAGIWKASCIFLFDAAGNYVTQCPADKGFATDLVVTGTPAVPQHGPLSVLYLTGVAVRPSTGLTGPGCNVFPPGGPLNVNEIVAVQGADVIASWISHTAAADPCLQSGNEAPLAVDDTIRTIGGNAHPFGGNPAGAEYTPMGTYTGVTFANPITAAENFLDGTRDATHNYAISGIGNVYSFDLNWRNPIFLFTLPPLGTSDVWTGIAYDASSNSLWVANGSNSTIENVTLGGTLLSSFIALAGPYGLAFDPADQTLWTYVLSPVGTFKQYSRSGSLLATQTYAALSNFHPTNPYFIVSGMEFAFPAAPNHPPIGNSQSVSIAGNTPASITLTGSDADNDALTFSIAAPPAHGSLSGTPPNVIYTPQANYTGTDSFTFTANDGHVASVPVAITISVFDNTRPVIVPLITGTAGDNGWYRGNVTVSWRVTDPESGIASTIGCDSVNLSAETTGTALTCTAQNGAGLSNSVPVTIRIDKGLPIISGMPGKGCTLWPPDHKMLTVATVTSGDTLSGVAPGSFSVTGTSNEPSNPKDPDIVITSNGSGGYVVQLRAERLGTGSGRKYTLVAKAADLAGNSVTVTAICTVPHDQGR